MKTETSNALHLSQGYIQITRKSLMVAASAAIMFGHIPLLASVAQAETVNITVPKAAVATAFNGALSSTKIHLHNLGPKNGTTWHKDASYILLPTGSKVPLPIAEYKYEINNIRHLKYYVNDLNTSSIQATVNGNRINVNANFESQGEEIKAKCVRKLAGNWGECSLDMERDIHLDNSILSISLNPVAYNGSISYDSPSTTFKTDLKIASKLCQAFKGICGWIEGKIKTQLTPTIESQVTKSFNDPKMKQAVADAVRNSPGINSLLKDWKVTKITSQGSNYIVTVDRPDQIDGSSVQKLSLTPTQKVVTSACPTTVKLDATIEMKHTVAGTGFLTYENGQKSNTFNWSAKKGQTVTSTVSRQFDGKPGSKNEGWGVMQVQWKGTDGKTYQEVSNKATFSVNCTLAAPGGIKL
jgi:hypothetical protein